MSLRLLARQVSFLWWGKSPPFYSGEVFHFRDSKNSDLGCRVCRGSCYVRARSTGHFFTVRSLFNGKSSDKSKEKSRSISSSEKSKSRSSNRPSKSGRSKVKSRSITASPPLPPVPHLFPFSTVLRQFLVVRSWFARGSTPVYDSENTCLYLYKMGADKSGRFEHLPLTHHYALVVSQRT